MIVNEEQVVSCRRQKDKKIDKFSDFLVDFLVRK